MSNEFVKFDPHASKRGFTSPEKMRIGDVVTRPQTNQQQRSALRNKMRQAYKDIGAEFSIRFNEETTEYAIRRDK